MTPEDERHLDRFAAGFAARWYIERFYGDHVQRDELFTALRSAQGRPVIVHYHADLRAAQRALRRELRANGAGYSAVHIRQRYVESRMRRLFLRDARVREFLSGPLVVRIEDTASRRTAGQLPRSGP